MKILVPVKRVPDYQAKVRVKADGSGIETDGIKWIVNPFDEIAVEEALKLKEAGAATEVIVVGIGPEDVQTQLRYALAMGADSAILVKTTDTVDSDLASRVLAALCGRADYRIVLMGKQAIDSDASQTPQLLAARTQRPQATFASKVLLEAGHAVVTREVDGGLETIRVPLPCVISTDLRLNTPRYASLPGIMKAKKKPMEEIEIGSLGIDLTPKVRLLRMIAPGKRQAGRKVGTVAELVQALQNEAKVL
jgi:electron transfer flavoprotein beta subunit